MRMRPAKTSNAIPKDGSELPLGAFGSRRVIIQLALVILVGFTAWTWFGILNTGHTESAVYALDVGQGDSQLVLLAENGGEPVKVLIDGGKDRRVLDELDRALGILNDKYIDIVILTHTDLDHLGGIVEVLKRYDVGLFVSNGRPADSDAYEALQRELSERLIPSVVLLEGDAIRYGSHVFSVLSPDRTLLKHKEVNESSIVMMLESEGRKILFTGDIGFPAEERLLAKKYDLDADVLKVPHHGSKYSSGENFLADVSPLVSLIGVGKNTYGHPTARVLDSLELAGSQIYRTDKHGTLHILFGDTTPRANTATTSWMSAAARIFFGDYAQSGITTISLTSAEKTKRESKLVPYRRCSYAQGKNPTHGPVILSEVAWMGSSGGATHEWIEFRNLSGKAVNLSGWQVINENERLRFTFPQQSIFDPFDKLRAGGKFLILARKAANDALDLNARGIFTGSIRNSAEGLRLFDNNCNLIDEVRVSGAWNAGDNKTKQTMERSSDFSWKTSVTPGGTPGF